MIPSAPVLLQTALRRADVLDVNLFPDGVWDEWSLALVLEHLAKLILRLCHSETTEDADRRVTTAIDIFVLALIDIGALWLLCRRHPRFMQAWAITPVEKQMVALYTKTIGPAEIRIDALAYIRSQTEARKHFPRVWKQALQT